MMIDNPADIFVRHDGIYLLNHSVGRPPKILQAKLAQSFFHDWESGDAEVWPEWIRQIEGFRSEIARLLNAHIADICPQVNLSSALSKVVHSLPASGSRNILLLHEQDFPSMGFVLQQAQRVGYSVRMIPADQNPQDIEVWRRHLNSEVALVLITHVHSNTSKLLPVAEIASYARTQGVISVVDVAQSVGVVPIDLHEWHADFVLGSCVKWLCGGPGAGFLWANPDVVDRCEPLDVGWFSHANPFEFDIADFRFADGAMRFWGGTPSVLPYVVAAVSIELINEI
ncbi:MAG: kynureninase, partial [Halieaceae bacterium]